MHDFGKKYNTEEDEDEKKSAYVIKKSSKPKTLKDRVRQLKKRLNFQIMKHLIDNERRIANKVVRLMKLELRKVLYYLEGVEYLVKNEEIESVLGDVLKNKIIEGWKHLGIET